MLPCLSFASRAKHLSSKLPDFGGGVLVAQVDWYVPWWYWDTFDPIAEVLLPQFVYELRAVNGWPAASSRAMLDSAHFHVDHCREVVLVGEWVRIIDDSVLRHPLERVLVNADIVDAMFVGALRARGYPGVSWLIRRHKGSWCT